MIRQPNPDKSEAEHFFAMDAHACAPKRYSAQARIYTDKGKKLSIFGKHKEVFKV
jgi:hypothetical protein